MEPIVRIPLPDPVAAADSAGRAGVGLDGGLLPWFVGPENRLVEVVVHAVLADATVQYNPLVLAGESGLGKSHLVLGLAAAYRAQYPRRPVVCLPAVDFSREWADAIESQSAVDFRRGYRAARLVVIEDVLRLADHEGAQQALVHVLDDATAAGHQVLVTAPSPPGHWPRIHAALQTRLEAGLCVRLASPSMETRLAILRDAAARRGPRLDEPAA
ncbi:MAG TPA: DnaA/Hda family protein, partial [Thermoguttaceae bacterium]|nr:DnaA/Hda family protein [Thermoguttaceae bacterium]